MTGHSPDYEGHAKGGHDKDGEHELKYPQGEAECSSAIVGMLVSEVLENVQGEVAPAGDGKND